MILFVLGFGLIVMGLLTVGALRLARNAYALGYSDARKAIVRDVQDRHGELVDRARREEETSA